MEKTIKKYWPIFLVPTLAAFLIGFIVPFILGVWLSFCDFTTVTDAKFIGFENYIRAFRTPSSSTRSGTRRSSPSSRFS